MATKAASYAALIRESLGEAVELEKGRRGQFEIVADGRTVVARKGGILAKLMGKPWPTEAHVLEALRKAQT